MADTLHEIGKVHSFTDHHFKIMMHSKCAPTFKRNPTSTHSLALHRPKSTLSVKVVYEFSLCQSLNPQRMRISWHVQSEKCHVPMKTIVSCEFRFQLIQTSEFRYSFSTHHDGKRSFKQMIRHP